MLFCTALAKLLDHSVYVVCAACCHKKKRKRKKYWYLPICVNTCGWGVCVCVCVCVCLIVSINCKMTSTAMTMTCIHSDDNSGESEEVLFLWHWILIYLASLIIMQSVESHIFVPKSFITNAAWQKRQDLKGHVCNCCAHSGYYLVIGSNDTECNMKVTIKTQSVSRHMRLWKGSGIHNSDGMVYNTSMS